MTPERGHGTADESVSSASVEEKVEEDEKHTHTTAEPISSENSLEIPRSLAESEKETLKNVRTRSLRDTADVESQLRELGEELTELKSECEDPDLVSWEGEDDPENPLNWSVARKYKSVALISLITLMPGITSSICSPAATQILHHYNNHNAEMGKLLTSVMLIVWGFSGSVMAPLSEMIGRKYVYVIGAIGGTAFDLGCAWAPSMATMVVFRGLCGMFNIPPLVLGAGCMADMFVAQERLWPLACWAIGPSLGPVVGPIIGSFIAQWSSWRWAYIVAGIAQGAFGILILLFFDEIYAPILLSKKCQRLRKQTGNPNLHTFWQRDAEPLSTRLKNALLRPVLYLFTNPLIFGLGLYIAFVYSLMFLMLTTFETMWIDRYHYQVYVGGLMYIGLAVGMILATIYWTLIMNHRLRSRAKKGIGSPEDNLYYLPFGAVQLSIGTFWYGWSAQGRVHWMMEQVGMALFGGGMVQMFQAIQPYVVLLNPRYASSAMAALVLFRCEMACAFPLFGQAMYNRLGYGWASTLIGLLLLLIGVPFPLALITNGPKMRKWVDEHSFIKD
nr:VrtL [Starmerella bombicola]